MATPTCQPTSTRRPGHLPGVPSWANGCAHVIALCTLPSAVWRIGIVVGFPYGYDQAWIHRSELDTAFGDVRMVGLCVLSEALALLAFGLVRRWGEVVPRWVPGLRGRCVPTWLPVLLAGAGGVALTAIWTSGIVYAAVTRTPFDPEASSGIPATVQLLAYAPMAVWGPLLLALTVHYARRRRP